MIGEAQALGAEAAVGRIEEELEVELDGDERSVAEVVRQQTI